MVRVAMVNYIKITQYILADGKSRLLLQTDTKRCWGCSIVAFSFIDGGNWITLKKPSMLVTKKLYNVE
jgi:hypothetical protein